MLAGAERGQNGFKRVIDRAGQFDDGVEPRGAGETGMIFRDHRSAGADRIFQYAPIVGYSGALHTGLRVTGARLIRTARRYRGDRHAGRRAYNLQRNARRLKAGANQTNANWFIPGGAFGQRAINDDQGTLRRLVFRQSNETAAFMTI
jgi:hypothetical protein